jgi:hypothetical protein
LAQTVCNGHDYAANSMKHSPLFSELVKHSPSFVGVQVWEAPNVFALGIDERQAVRERLGFFDASPGASLNLWSTRCLLSRSMCWGCLPVWRTKVKLASARRSQNHGGLPRILHHGLSVAGMIGQHSPSVP